MSPFYKLKGKKSTANPMYNSTSFCLSLSVFGFSLSEAYSSWRESQGWAQILLFLWEMPKTKWWDHHGAQETTTRAATTPVQVRVPNSPASSPDSKRAVLSQLAGSAPRQRCGPVTARHTPEGEGPSFKEARKIPSPKQQWQQNP